MANLLKTVQKKLLGVTQLYLMDAYCILPFYDNRNMMYRYLFQLQCIIKWQHDRFSQKSPRNDIYPNLPSFVTLQASSSGAGSTGTASAVFFVLRLDAFLLAGIMWTNPSAENKYNYTTQWLLFESTSGTTHVVVHEKIIRSFGTNYNVTSDYWLFKFIFTK